MYLGRVARSCGPLHLHLAVAGVRAERARGSELAELVPDHLLRDEDGNVLAAVVDRDRVPDHLGKDRRGARPGTDHVLRARGVHRLDADDQAVGFLVLASRALAERRHAPRRDRVAAALGLALAAAVRVVDGVHRGAAHGRALAQPATPAGLAAGDVFVVEVADLSDRR